MTRQLKRSRRLKSIAGTAVVGLGLAILFGQLEGPAAQLTNLLGTAARETMALLPYWVPAVGQALAHFAFSHLRFSPCLVQMLLSFWPLVRLMAIAA